MEESKKSLRDIDLDILKALAITMVVFFIICNLIPRALLTMH